MASYSSPMRDTKFSDDGNILYISVSQDTSCSLIYTYYNGISWSSINQVPTSAIPILNMDPYVLNYVSPTNTIYMNGSGNIGIYKTNVSISNVSNLQNFSTVNLNDNSWHYVQWLIQSNGTYSYYIDNSLIYTTSGQIYPAAVSRTQNYIGVSQDLSMSYFNGGIDDFNYLNLNSSTMPLYYKFDSIDTSNNTIANWASGYPVYDSLMLRNGLYYQILYLIDNSACKFIANIKGNISYTTSYSSNFSSIDTATNYFFSNGTATTSTTTFPNYTAMWYGYFNVPYSSSSTTWAVEGSGNDVIAVYLTSPYSITTSTQNNYLIYKTVGNATATTTLFPATFTPLTIFQVNNNAGTTIPGTVNTTSAFVSMQNASFSQFISKMSDLTGYVFSDVSSAQYIIAGDNCVGDSALDLTQNNSFVKIGNFMVTSFGISFAFWFKANSTATNSCIFDFGLGYNQDNAFISVNSNNYLVANMCIGTTLTSYVVGTGNNNFQTINDNTWRHFAWTITYTAQNVGSWNFYLNGSLLDSSSNALFPNFYNWTNNYIGKSNNPSYPLFNGKIDDFRVYNGVYSSSDIAGFYKYGNTKNITINGMNLNNIFYPKITTTYNAPAIGCQINGVDINNYFEGINNPTFANKNVNSTGILTLGGNDLSTYFYSLPSMQVWLDASDTANIALFPTGYSDLSGSRGNINGNSVLSWRCKCSGRYAFRNNLSSVVYPTYNFNYPTYSKTGLNGNSAIQMSSSFSGMYMPSPTGTFNNGATMFAVYSTDRPSDFDFINKSVMNTTTNYTYKYFQTNYNYTFNYFRPIVNSYGTNMVLDYDASYNVVTGISYQVVSWTDTYNGIATTPSGTSPLLNNRYIDFNTQGSYLVANNTANATSNVVTLFFILKIGTAKALNQFCSSNGSWTTGSIHLFFNASNALTISLNGTGIASTDWTSATTFTTGQTYIFTIKIDGRTNSTANFNYNGTSGGSNTYGSSANTWNTKLEFGGWDGTGSTARVFSGGFNEILQFNSILSTAQVQLIEGALAYKWGLQSNLPSTHPYYYGNANHSNPLNILDSSSIILNFDANYNVSTTGNQVNSWTDTYGSISTTPSGTKPTYTSGLYPAIDFNTQWSYLSTNLSANATSSSVTLFIVLKITGSSSVNTILISTSTYAAGTIHVFMYSQNALVLATTRDGTTTTEWTTNLTLNVGQPYLLTIQFDGRTNTIAYLNCNGTSYGFNQYSALSIMFKTNFDIGGYSLNVNWKLNGGISEVIQFNSILTTQQLQLVEGVLAWKWGLNNSLPSSHPYSLINPSQFYGNVSGVFDIYGNARSVGNGTVNGNVYGNNISYSVNTPLIYSSVINGNINSSVVNWTENLNGNTILNSNITIPSGGTFTDNGNVIYFNQRADNLYTSNNVNYSEILLYNKVFSNSNVQYIEGYLANKWGLQSYLPSTHPYRNLRIPISYNEMLSMPITGETSSIIGAKFLQRSNIMVAYSVRLLIPSYTGPVMNIRRASDNATSDFYADMKQTYLTTGANNTGQSYSSWIGNSTGYVTRWYDQSNNSVMDASNSVTTISAGTISQPPLVSLNSKYVINFVTSNATKTGLLINNGGVDPSAIFTHFTNDNVLEGTIFSTGTSSGQRFGHYSVAPSSTAGTRILGDSTTSDWYYSCTGTKFVYNNGVDISNTNLINYGPQWNILTMSATGKWSGGKMYYIGTDSYNTYDATWANNPTGVGYRGMNGYMIDFMCHNKAMQPQDMVDYYNYNIFSPYYNVLDYNFRVKATSASFPTTDTTGVYTIANVGIASVYDTIRGYVNYSLGNARFDITTVLPSITIPLTITFWGKINTTASSGLRFRIGSITHDIKINSTGNNAILSAGTGSVTLSSSSFISKLFNWNFFTYVVYSNKLIFYVNGIYIATVNYTAISSSLTGGIVYNATTVGANEYTDDIRLYMRVLTTTEILAIYNSV